MAATGGIQIAIRHIFPLSMHSLGATSKTAAWNTRRYSFYFSSFYTLIPPHLLVLAIWV